MIDLLRGFMNWLFEPSIALTLTIVMVWALYRYRRICTQNKFVAGAIVASPVLFFFFSAFPRDLLQNGGRTRQTELESSYRI